MPQTLIQHIEDIARSQHFESILEETADLKDYAIDHNFLDVVVLGQFKAGKSSMINDLLGKEILPVGVLPVTAIITRIFFGNEEKATITFLDGQKVEKPLSDLKDYVTEKRNPENKKQVALVDITLPTLKAFKKLRFIDTPGLGSAFEHNTTVTEKWFNKIAVAFVVISATQPLSKKDIEVITTAAEQSPEVFLVLSKTDLIDTVDQAEVMEFIQNKTREKLNRNFQIFPYSTVNGHGNFRDNIRKNILESLVLNHGKTRQSIYSHKINHLSALTQSYLKIRLQLAGKEENERQNLKNKILDEQLQLQFVQKELNYIAKHYTEETRSKLEKIFLEEKQQTLTHQLQSRLEKDYNQWTGNLYQVARNYEAWLKTNMKKALQEMERNNRPAFQQMLYEAQIHFNHYTTHFRERLNQRIEQVLHVSLPPEEFKVRITPLEKPDISTSWAFESHIDMLWFLVPMRLLRSSFLKSFQRQLPRETEKNLRRLVSILTSNINTAIEQSHGEALNYIRGRLSSIEHLLAQQSSNVKELQRMIVTLEKF